MNTTEEATIDVYIVSSGLLDCAVVGEEACRTLCKRFEMLDPWRGIPFTKRVPMTHTEALRTMQEINVKQALETVKRESNK
jgi:hypothetical protein|tara:strand:- start:455 stop:697 length:243 start_codon:yes stop_codon:yes gene_type:complete